jgi:hypothetical protein
MAERRHARRVWALFRTGSLCAAVLLIAVAMAIVGTSSSGSPHLARIQAQNDSLAVAATSAPTCALGVVGQLLGMCNSATISTTTASTTDCNVLEQLLNMRGIPTTTTTTTTDPPTSGSGGCAGTSPPTAPRSGTWSCTLPGAVQPAVLLAFTSAFGMDGSDTFEPGTTPLPDTMRSTGSGSGSTYVEPAPGRHGAGTLFHGERDGTVGARPLGQSQCAEHPFRDHLQPPLMGTPAPRPVPSSPSNESVGRPLTATWA